MTTNSNTTYIVNPANNAATDTTTNPARPESNLRAAARKHGLTIKELAARMGVSPSHLSQVATGNRTFTPNMRARVAAVLGEVPEPGFVYHQPTLVESETTYVRERAREMGLSMRKLAERVGVTYCHLNQAARGRKIMSPGVQARVEAALDAPLKVEPAERAEVDPRALWERMDAHRISQNEVARRAGITSGYLSLVMNGQRKPSGDVLRRLHAALFAPSPAELVAPVELKVLGWKKGGRNGMVIRGAGGPKGGGKVGDGTIRVGGRVPWGAEVEFAYTTGYDGHGRVSVNRLVDERGCSAMLKQRGAVGD